MKKYSLDSSNSFILVLSGVIDFLVVFFGLMLLNRLFILEHARILPEHIYLYSSVYFLIYMFMGISFDLYTLRYKKKYDIIFGVVVSCMVSGAIIMLVDYISGTHSGNARILFTMFAFVCAMLCIWRIIFNKIIRMARGTQKLLVIESKGMDNTFARKIKYSCLDWFDSWYTGIDTEDDDAVTDFINREFKEYNNIFITQSIPVAVKDRLIEAAIDDDKNIYFLPSLYDMHITKYDMVQFSDTPSFCIKPFRLNMSQKVMKRLADIVLSLIGLILASPVMLFTAIAIKLEDKGKVIYSQQRITQNERPFYIYKFRTMIENAERVSGPVLATESDSRITKVGKYLRMLRIDEIPQLINILKGDMSIVGPRPERPKFVEEYSNTIPDYNRRHIVKAGLTGYAQVYSNYDTEINDKLLYDLLYIREYSFLLDIKIILLTIKTVFKKEASQGVKTKNRWESKTL